MTNWRLMLDRWPLKSSKSYSYILWSVFYSPIPSIIISCRSRARPTYDQNSPGWKWRAKRASLPLGYRPRLTDSHGLSCRVSFFDESVEHFFPSDCWLTSWLDVMSFQSPAAIRYPLHTLLSTICTYIFYLFDTWCTTYLYKLEFWLTYRLFVYAVTSIVKAENRFCHMHLN